MPLASTTLCAFNVAVVVQEFVRGLRARRRSNTEVLPVAFLRLVGKARHRYGGYVVHLGIVLMFAGFTGRSWSVDKQVSIEPGDSFALEHYRIRYLGSRTEVDETKQMVFADLLVTDPAGREIGRPSPAKFFYRKSPESPTTEVALIRTVRDDLYLVAGAIDNDRKTATLHVHVNPLVSFIWLGVLILILGTAISMWPQIVVRETLAWEHVRASALRARERTTEAS
jgi:cytochrome c-type biogenesis protein CcmF